MGGPAARPRFLSFFFLISGLGEFRPLGEGERAAWWSDSHPLPTGLLFLFVIGEGHGHVLVPLFFFSLCWL